MGIRGRHNTDTHHKMASGDNVDTIEVVESSIAGPADSTGDHEPDDDSADEDREFADCTLSPKKSLSV